MGPGSKSTCTLSTLNPHCHPCAVIRSEIQLDHTHTPVHEPDYHTWEGHDSTDTTLNGGSEDLIPLAPCDLSAQTMTLDSSKINCADTAECVGAFRARSHLTALGCQQRKRDVLLVIKLHTRAVESIYLPLCTSL